MAPKSSEAVSFRDQGLNLEGKEVWLVQVPPDFESSKATVKSEHEVEYDGTSYSLLTNGTQVQDCNVLVSVNSDTKLVSTSVKPRGVLSLTKKVAIPKIDYETAHMPKPTVPQKENLRMRHYPTGYGPQSFGIDETAAVKKKTHMRDDNDSTPRAKKLKTSGESSKDAKSKSKKSKDKSDQKEKKSKSDKKKK